MRKERVAALARAQHGLITRAQAFELGMSEGEIRFMTTSGEWILLRRGIYMVAALPRGPQQDLLAAVMAGGPGTVASHAAAAWLWGLSETPALEVCSPWGGPTGEPAVVRHRRAVPARDVCVRKGVPVTKPLPTLLDVAATDPALLETAIDRGVATKLFTVKAVDAELRRKRRKGHRGVAVLEAALRDRDLGRSASVLESKMLRLLRRAGLPEPVREFEVLGGRYRIDFAWPHVLLAVEVDGYADHTSPTAFRRDRARRRALTAMGWTIIEYTWDEIVSDPARVAREIAAELLRLSA